jgi:hypothetical protein
MRVTGYGLRVAGYGIQGCVIRVVDCGMHDAG